MTVRDLREGGGTLRADLCILGAGAAGITIARELAGSTLDVVLVESGGFELDIPTQNLYAGTVVGEPLLTHGNELGLDDIRLRYFGGTTNHWAGYCRPLDEVDFAIRPYLPVSGWPFGIDELAPWYERAADVIQLVSARFDLPWWQAEHGVGEPVVDDDTVRTRLFQVHYPFSFGAAYRTELEQAPNVQVVTWANATELLVEPESDRVSAIAIRTLDGVEGRVEATAFVVALGGIETPRLLLASDQVRTQGLGNGHDLVGRHFTEHLQALAGVTVFGRPADDLALYNGVAVTGTGDPPRTVTLKGVLTLPDSVVVAEELLGFEAQMLVTPPAPGSPEYANGLGVDALLGLVAAVDDPPGTSTAFVQVLGEQQLDPESRVLLGRDRDPLGMPRVELDWRHSELDRRSIVTGLQLLGRTLGRTGVGRLQVVLGGASSDQVPADGASALGVYGVSVDDIDLDTFPIGVGYHHMCTTRMATDPTRGVVDADCRVHDLGNLYVAGSAAFATGGVSTPTLTITALALRLAEHLRRNVLA